MCVFRRLTVVIKGLYSPKESEESGVSRLLHKTKCNMPVQGFSVLQGCLRV